MNLVGATVWAGVERGATGDEILGDVVATFRIDAERARTDVESFLTELEAAGLARREDTNDAGQG